MENRIPGSNGQKNLRDNSTDPMSSSGKANVIQTATF